VPESEEPKLPDDLDLVRIEKADGCVWEYRVRGLRLEYIGVPAEHRAPGEAMGSLELEADEVFEHRSCGAEEDRPSPPYDHVSLRVTDLEVSRAFYLAALAPVSFEVLYEFPEFLGMGSGGRASLWLAADAAEPTAHVHLCFEASSAEAVDSFHAAALEAGGTCHGPPGLRPRYHPGYYAAFVLDPDGNNLELVFHDRALQAAASDEEE
jgi:catechol 2,3-dioxygenase-like lactoylglutathione lyase family enzyme